MFIWTLPFILLLQCAKKAAQKPKALQKTSTAKSKRPQSVKKASEHPKKPEMALRKEAPNNERVEKKVERTETVEEKVVAKKASLKEKPVVKEKTKTQETEEPVAAPQVHPPDGKSPITNLTKGFADVYRLDNTTREENCPAVNGLVIHYLAENNANPLILDPHKIEYLGNIDKKCLNENNKLNLYNEMAGAIQTPAKDGATTEKSASEKLARKVVFKEERCKLYEVDDPYDDNQPDESGEDTDEKK